MKSNMEKKRLENQVPCSTKSCEPTAYGPDAELARTPEFFFYKNRMILALRKKGFFRFRVCARVYLFWSFFHVEAVETIREELFFPLFAFLP
jgi:hypothetical protein